MSYIWRLKKFIRLLGVLIVISLIVAFYINEDMSQTLGDLPGFRFLINPAVCGDRDIYMLIVIGSHPNNYNLRNVLRQTLGEPGIEGKIFKTVFPVGHLENATQQQLLVRESEKHQDIIQGNFNDSYRNITLRDLMGLRWAWKYCPQARFIMRLDDDVSVDIYKVVEAVERYSLQLTTAVGCCMIYTEGQVLRNGRYALTKTEHPADVFRPYCGGWMYVLTPRMAYNLDVASRKVKPYWMNDAYITGTLVEAIGGEHISLNISYTKEIEDMLNSANMGPPRYVLGPTGGNPDYTSLLHHKYKSFAMSYH